MMCPAAFLWAMPWAVLVTGLLADPADGHIGERLLPIPQVPAHVLEGIDLDDGSIDDWREALGPPLLTALDFEGSVPYDPANLDFRIWLAWGEPGRLYMAAVFADDAHYYEDHPGGFMVSDNVSLAVDGDHTGGEYDFRGPHGDDPTTHESHRQAQRWHAVSQTENGRASVELSVFEQEDYGPWMYWPPFAHGGGDTAGENPTIWVVELYVTAWDELDSRGPDYSRISDFRAGQIIGLSVGVMEWDRRNQGGNDFFGLRTTAEPDPYGGADNFSDGILLGPDGQVPTAIRWDSWSRIKATFGP